MRRLARKSLDRLPLSDRETQDAVREEYAFIERLEGALRGEDHDEKRAAVERCAVGIRVIATEPLSIAVASSIKARGS